MEVLCPAEYLKGSKAARWAAEAGDWICSVQRREMDGPERGTKSWEEAGIS